MSSAEPIRTASIGETAGETATTLGEAAFQVIVFIGETALAKLPAKQRRSGETALLTNCNRWRNRNEPKQAKQRNSETALYYVWGGGAPLACAPARPALVSK